MKPLNKFSLNQIILIIIISNAPSQNPSFQKLEIGEPMKDSAHLGNQSIIALFITDTNCEMLYYMNNDHNETINFNDIYFSLGKNNSLTISDGINTYTGTLNIMENKYQEEDISDIKFNFMAALPIKKEEITDNLEIIEKSAEAIEFRDFISGFDGTDLMVFGKN